MGKLLLLFIAVPVVELFLLIELGQLIGTLATLGLIVLTGTLGAYLARRQGMGILHQMRAEMAAGQLPAGSIFDGIIILMAGAVLITPGILTDLLGFLCLIPVTRRAIKSALWRWFERLVREGRVGYSSTIEIRDPPLPPNDIDPP